MPKVAIIVLNWNSANDTIRCIDSLKQQTFLPTIILVDNNSTDDSVSQLNKYLRNLKNIEVIFTKNQTNLGYAGGINTGMRYAISQGFDYVGTLNPDATADKKWLEYLIEEFTDSSIGVTAGLLLSSNGDKIDSTGEIYTIWGLPAPRHRNQPRNAAPSKPGYIFGASGGASVYRTSMLQEVGLFDEEYFMYFEDVDICFRAQLSGHKVRFTPKAIAYHDHGTSSKKVPGLTVYQTFKNVPMLFWKNVPLKLFPKIFPRFVLTYTAILASSVFKGNAWPAIKGFLASIRLLPHSLIERKRIQSSAKVDAQYIDSIILQDTPQDQTGLRKLRKVILGR